jgi:hypothetical protein
VVFRKPRLAFHRKLPLVACCGKGRKSHETLVVDWQQSTEAV